jgi:hypothetical protein
MEGADVLAGVSGIHLGEAEAILLAQKLGTELIIDEGEASVTTQMFGVSKRTSKTNISCDYYSVVF